MEEVFDKLANIYDKWFETPLGKKIFLSERKCIEELIQEGDGKLAIDLGIGTGLFTLILRDKGYKVIGVDISDRMLEIAKQRGFEVIKHDLNLKLPFDDEVFDFAFSMTTIEMLKNRKEFVNEVYRILKKDSKFLLIALNSLSLWALIRRIKGLFIKDYVFKKGKFLSPKDLLSLFDEKWEILIKKTSTFIPPYNPVFLGFWENFIGKIFKSNGAISVILAKRL